MNLHAIQREVDRLSGGRGDGAYLKVLFQRLGIADNMRAKYRNARGGEAVAAGEVELGVTQISEILHQKGTDLAGPRPPARCSNTSCRPTRCA